MSTSSTFWAEIALVECSSVQNKTKRSHKALIQSQLRDLLLCLSADAEKPGGRGSPEKHLARFAVGSLLKRVHLKAVVIRIGFLWLYVGPEGKGQGLLTCPHESLCTQGLLKQGLFAFQAKFGNALVQTLGAGDFVLGPNSFYSETHPAPSQARLSELVSDSQRAPDTFPPCQGSHCHLKLLHPLPLHFLCLAEELEALLSLEVD